MLRISRAMALMERLGIYQYLYVELPVLDLEFYTFMLCEEVALHWRPTRSGR